jgi:cytidylate kinase
MRITITGPPGSGKSTVAKLLAKKLKLTHYSAGDIRRKLAAKKGISLAELNKKDEKTHETDKIVDDYQIKLGKTKDNFVIDGRLPAFFIPNSIKIFLDVDPLIGAKRVMDRRKGVEVYKNVKEAAKKLKERDKSDQKRYKQLYGINYADKKKYDLVIDTTKTKAEGIVKQIIKFVKTDPKPL